MEELEKLEMLRKEVDEFLKETYGMELTIPININRRLKRKLGRFRFCKRNEKPIAIELSEDLVRYQEREVLIDVLKEDEILQYSSVYDR